MTQNHSNKSSRNQANSKKVNEKPISPSPDSTKPACNEELAELAFMPTTTNGMVAGMYSSKTMKVNLELKEMVIALNVQVKQVQRGDLKNAESLLMSQAMTLNAIFTEMARRAAINLGEHLNAAETYLRLGLKAQNQCRTTLETLTAIKRPPILIAKQANISAGHQQINNVQVNGVSPVDQIRPIQLSEIEHELHKNTRAQSLESDPYSTLEAMGAVNRPKVPRG